MFVVNAATFNGVSSYQRLTIDSTKVPYGQSGSLEFRTRALSGRVLYIQVYGNQFSYIDLLLSQGKLQVQLQYPQRK